MSDARLQRLYRAGMAGPERAEGAPVPLDEMEALAAGTLLETRRLELLDRVMSDSDLLQEFELLRSVHRAGVAEAPGRVARRPLGLVALAVAAVVALAIGTSVLLRSSGGRDAPRMRGVSGVSAVSSRAPEEGATVPEPVVLVWSALPDAVGYRVEVLDGAGAPAFRETTRDTMLATPLGAFVPGAEYRWWVEAVHPEGVAQSEVRSFVLEP